jgi:hypothetical protein
LDWRRLVFDEGCPYFEAGKNPASADSYRPISLIGCDRKLMEKMLCIRLDIWAERNNVLFPTQYGFRKGKGTRDCLALLTTDINNSFEMKEQIVSAFLDISVAYDNVIIDILCEVMVELELPIHIIRLLWNLLKKKKKAFYVGGIEYIIYICRALDTKVYHRDRC